jgi:hypothetical protein
MSATLCVPGALPRELLLPEQVDEMYGLLWENFRGVTREQFEKDLGQKNWVILLYRDERLMGFSTLLAYETEFRGEPVSVIYSGDTIVAREAWGTPELAKRWISAVNELRGDYPNGKFYWLLLTSGFRTYRFLPVFWRTFFPCFERGTLPEDKELVDHLASELFGDEYDPESGVVHFKHAQILRDELNEVPEGRLKDPHIGFFLERNPGCFRGDELVCLTKLTEANLTAAGKRMTRG